jgi:ATP-dependent DNA helicase HFM1/MER3
LQDHFDFSEFNPIQKQCLPKIMKSDSNMIVSAPTSSGKTALFEMAILKYSHFSSPMCLYLAPIKSLCH